MALQKALTAAVLTLSIAAAPAIGQDEAASTAAALAELGKERYLSRDLDGAEEALVQAIAQGAERPGDLWIIIGHARYEAGDIDGALRAFRQGQAYPQSRDDAAEWAEFIEAERTEWREDLE